MNDDDQATKDLQDQRHLDQDEEAKDVAALNNMDDQIQGEEDSNLDGLMNDGQPADPDKAMEEAGIKPEGDEQHPAELNSAQKMDDQDQQ